MKTIELGPGVKIDLPKLIESRALIQANSGGGKSFTIRRVTEQAFGKVQIIILDPEGEFGNLRGKYDFVYVGPNGDAPAEPRSAALLARRLLETKASAIVDIFELGAQERKHFVRLFLDAMVNAPKELWHDCIIILDEAHKFAPEKEQSEALEAVADMASRGRKRGFCLIPATQRPAKLNKDVAAECNNKLIGRASLDIDRKRSAEELGFTTKDEILSLRNLEPGEFYAFGPAISKDIVRVKVGGLQVPMPARGQSAKSVPAPTEKVKQILAQFKDLPAEAVQETATIQSLTAEVARLKREATNHKCPVGPSSEKVKEVAEGLVSKAKLEIERAYDDELRRFKKKTGQLRPSLVKIQEVVSDLLKVVDAINGENPTVIVPKPEIRLSKELTAPATKVVTSPPVVKHIVTDGLISGPEQKVLAALAWLLSVGQPTPKKAAVAAIAGYSPTSGGYSNLCSTLKTKGLIAYPSGGLLGLTDAGAAAIGTPDLNFQTNEEVHAFVLERLSNPEGKVLRPVLAAYPGAISKEQIAAATGYSASSGGFSNLLSSLRTLGFIDYPSKGVVRAEDILFPLD